MYCCYYSINVFIQNDGCSYVFWVVKKKPIRKRTITFYNKFIASTSYNTAQSQE